MKPSAPKVSFLCKQPFWNFSEKDGQSWCKSCQRQIPDLREADPETIADLLKRDGGESCGLFYRDQFEINEQTKKGPPVLRIVLASALTIFTASKVHSQTVTDSVKTVQTDSVSKPQNQSEAPAAEIVQNPVVQENYPVQAKRPLFTRRKHLFWLGRKDVWISWRFPFLHIRRPVRGRFKY